jgi:RNA polymerase sigma-70 factor (ECF subfamily)
VTTLDDRLLLEAARAGDSSALAKLIERYQAPVYRFGMQMCRHPEDAEDVLQDTLLAAARSIGDFREGASLSTWLYTIARRFCIKKRRRSKYAPEHEHSLEGELDPEAKALTHPGRGPDELAHERELGDALNRALRQLEPEQREVLVLRDFEGLKANEVSQVVGISVAAVKSRLHRARAKLAELLRPLLEAPTPVRARTAT